MQIRVKGGYLLENISSDLLVNCTMVISVNFLFYCFSDWLFLEGGGVPIHSLHDSAMVWESLDMSYFHEWNFYHLFGG